MSTSDPTMSQPCSLVIPKEEPAFSSRVLGRSCSHGSVGKKPTVHEDGYAWVKYGEKKLTPSRIIREYYRCKNWRDANAGGTGCQAKKVIDREDDGPQGDPTPGKKARAVFPRHSPCQTPEFSTHNHPPPNPRINPSSPSWALPMSGVVNTSPSGHLRTHSGPFASTGLSPPSLVSPAFSSGPSWQTSSMTQNLETLGTGLLGSGLLSRQYQSPPQQQQESPSQKLAALLAGQGRSAPAQPQLSTLLELLSGGGREGIGGLLSRQQQPQATNQTSHQQVHSHLLPFQALQHEQSPADGRGELLRALATLRNTGSSASPELSDLTRSQTQGHCKDPALVLECVRLLAGASQNNSKSNTDVASSSMLTSGRAPVSTPTSCGASQPYATQVVPTVSVDTTPPFHHALSRKRPPLSPVSVPKSALDPRPWVSPTSLSPCSMSTVSQQLSPVDHPSRAASPVTLSAPVLGSSSLHGYREGLVVAIPRSTPEPASSPRIQGDTAGGENRVCEAELMEMFAAAGGDAEAQHGRGLPQQSPNKRMRSTSPNTTGSPGGSGSIGDGQVPVQLSELSDSELLTLLDVLGNQVAGSLSKLL